MDVNALSAGVHGLRLAQVASDIVDADPSGELAALAQRALIACEQIEARTSLEEATVIEIARGAGVVVTSDPPPQPRQNHTIRLQVTDSASAHRLAVNLGEHGYVQWEKLNGGARKSFDRTASWLTVAQTTDVTVVVRISWRVPPTRGRLARALCPTAADWHTVDVPDWAWPVYTMIRPVRLVAERLGLRRRHESGLGPFLSTPDALLGPLFDFADVGAADLVVDLGCGDGRIVIEAAATRECRGRGVDNDEALIREGQRRAVDRRVAEQVTLTVGDARDFDVADASVVFAFLPVHVIAEILPGLLERMRTGASLVVHEQNALPASIPESDSSEVVLAADAVTVAHRWTVL